MAAIKCTGCGTYISVKGMVNCPKCGAYLSPPHHTPTPASVPKAIPGAPKMAGSPTPKTSLKISDYFTILGVTSLAGVIAFVVYMVAFPSAEKKEQDAYTSAVRAALFQCQTAIASTAKYGGSDTPPYVKNNGSKDDFYFAWPRGSFYFTNAYGAKEAMSASCNGSLKDGTISSMTLNAKDLIQ